MELKEWLEQWVEGNLTQAKAEQDKASTPSTEMYWHGQITKLEQLKASIAREVWKEL